MTLWRRKKNTEPIKYEVYNLQLEDVFGADTTGHFSDLAKLFKTKYFDDQYRNKRRPAYGEKPVVSESQPPWYDRINIIAPGFSQKLIQSKPYFQPKVGSCFVIMYEDGRIERLRVTAPKQLTCYYNRNDKFSDDYIYSRSDFEIGEFSGFRTSSSGSFSMENIVKIIMLTPVAKPE